MLLSKLGDLCTDGDDSKAVCVYEHGMMRVYLHINDLASDC